MNKINVQNLTTAEIKVSLLSKGINFDLNIFEEISEPFYDNQFVYGQTSKGVTPSHSFPQVILLGNGINCAILHRRNSPWKILNINDCFQLYFEDIYVQNIHIPERPAYFDRLLCDGTPTQNIIAVAGEATPGFFFYPNCYYFNIGSPCSFCSMKGTRETVGKHMANYFTELQIRECIQIVEDTPWRDISVYSVTTGTCKTDEEIIQSVIDPLRIMSDSMRIKKPIHLLTHPPVNLSLIQMFKDSGVTSIAFNLEVYDRKLFDLICRGKSLKYGYDAWIDAIMYAKNVFGEYNAFCGFVWGLEPIESTIEGNEFLAENGIGIASNIFHADDRCIFRNHPHLNESGIIEIAKSQYELYRRFPAMKTIFPVSMRSTIDWEIKRGDFR